MKTITVLLAFLMVVGGLAAMALGTLSGIGYALYSFANDVPIALALWNGFALFLKMLIGGFISFVVGYGVQAAV